MGEKEEKTVEQSAKVILPASERRKFVKASLAVGPVLLTIASKPVLGWPGQRNAGSTGSGGSGT